MKTSYLELKEFVYSIILSFLVLDFVFQFIPSSNSSIESIQSGSKKEVCTDFFF